MDKFINPVHHNGFSEIFPEFSSQVPRKPKQFEDDVRRVRWQQGAWVKYASWEETQGDLRRARSVWERALEVDATSPQTWQRYAEMEMRARAVSHARNLPPAHAHRVHGVERHYLTTTRPVMPA